MEPFVEPARERSPRRVSIRDVVGGESVSLEAMTGRRVKLPPFAERPERQPKGDFVTTKSFRDRHNPAVRATVQIETV